MKNKTIKVGYLARVEGEGGLYVRTKGGRVADVKLNIFEPPRFFEAFLRGRFMHEVPDITARICGICPVAYRMILCKLDGIGKNILLVCYRFAGAYPYADFLAGHVLNGL